MDRFGHDQIGKILKNVTFSVVLHPGLVLGEVQIFSLMAGIVVARVLEKFISGIRLKWPNDVLVNDFQQRRRTQTVAPLLATPCSWNVWIPIYLVWRCELS